MNTNTFRFYLFTALAALFIGIGFTSTDFITLPAATYKDLFILGAQWAVVVAAVFFLLLILTVKKGLFAVLFPVLTLLSAVLAYFRYTIRATLTPMILDAALENDYRTSAELCTPGLIGFAVGSFLLSWLFVRYRFRKVTVSKPLYPFLAGCFGLLVFTHIGAFKRPISERIPFNIYYTFRNYWEEKQVISEDRKDLTAGIRCSDEPVTVVFVLGESLRPDHLGLNGYERNTTPLLSQEDVISFPYIYTEQTYTNRSLPHILTRADSTDYDRAYREKSFVNLFEACGFYTVWLANQEAASTYVYFMNECDSLIYANMDKSVYVFDRWTDEDLLPHFDRTLQRREEKNLIILHTIGSHWWYNSHFTEEYARYQPLVKSKVISSCTQEEMINSYDNTVLYTDYFLSELINRLRDRNAVLIYQSDHGEALGEDGVWLHATETPYTHEAACLVWMSPAYKEKYPAYYEAARRNALKRFRTDYLFHSILEAGGIGSDYINGSLSIFRSDN